MSEHNGAGQGVINAITHTMESYTSRQVFGEPITNGNVMIIPVARVRGGGGISAGGPVSPAWRWSWAAASRSRRRPKVS